MVNPMNLASLKFSGKLRVLIAYKVHKVIKNRSQRKGDKNAAVVDEHMTNILRGL